MSRKTKYDSYDDAYKQQGYYPVLQGIIKNTERILYREPAMILIYDNRFG